MAYDDLVGTHKFDSVLPALLLRVTFSELCQPIFMCRVYS